MDEVESPGEPHGQRPLEWPDYTVEGIGDHEDARHGREGVWRGEQGGLGKCHTDVVGN